MQFLPDGTVKIFNKTTGESRVVKPDDLPSFGIDYSDYQTQKTAYDQTLGGTSKAVTDAQNAENAKQQLGAGAAKNVLDVLAKRANGEMSDEDYQAALQGTASDYNSKRAFGEGGKNLTANERAMLSGQLIDINQKNPTAWQKFWGNRVTGITPMTTSQISEDEDSIRRKMVQAILRADPKADVSAYLNMPISSGKKNTNKEIVSSTGEKLNTKPTGFVENVVNNAVDFVKGLPKLGREVLKMTPAEGAIDLISGKKSDPLEGAKTAVELGKELLQSFTETTGINKNTIGIREDGHFYWNPGQQVKDAFVHDYNHPIDTALWILPFLKSAKGTSGIVGEAADGASTAEKALVETTTRGTETLPGISSKAGKAATSIANPIPESVIKSEEIMSKALQNTKSNSIRGMAKELEESIPTQSKVIDNWAITKDAEIGSQPLAEVKAQILQKVADTTSAKANPQLLKIIDEDLSKQLSTGELPGGMATGNIEATNFESLNKTRKYMTSGLDSWFNNGQPVGTPTNDLNALRWQTANAIKDIFSEADTQGIVKSALDKQHTAFQTAPVLSKMVWKTGPGISAISLKWSLIRKAWEATGGKILESAKINNARSLQGELPSIETPTETVPTINTNNPLPQVQQANLSPLPEQTIQSVIQSKGPAQSARLVEDTGYGLPEITRRSQNNILKQSSKKKYK